MIKNNNESRDFSSALRSGVLGLAAGDAFGMPYETGKRGTFDIYADTFDEATGTYKMKKYVEGMPAYWFDGDLPAGTWTDDTAMTLATMHSIASLRKIDPDDIMKRFVEWNDGGAFSATGKSIGQGRKTLAALDRYKSGTPAVECGGSAETDNGDGSLMRMLPFVFLEDMMKSSGVTVAELSSLTHAHRISVRSCEIYVDFSRALLRTWSRDEACRTLAGLEAPFDRLGRIASLGEDEISSGGYVVEALEASLWCFLATDSYVDCILKAVSLGGDTDTIAAIAGSLAGMYYGIDAIPGGWLDALGNRELIERIISDFGAVM